MKYFIGIHIPKDYKHKIELLRAEFRFFSTEPHITIVPPPSLPDNDSFIKNTVEVCRKTEKFHIKLGSLEQFGRRVLYVSVDSPELTALYNNLFQSLGLKKEARDYTPHLTVIKERRNRKIDIDIARKRTEVKLPEFSEYDLNSVTIYRQPKERFIYVPYMQIPIGR